MRNLVLLAILALIACVATACSDREKAESCNIPSDRQQSTSLNDRARRAQYSDLSNQQFDSVAAANCWTVAR